MRVLPKGANNSLCQADGSGSLPRSEASVQYRPLMNTSLLSGLGHKCESKQLGLLLQVINPTTIHNVIPSTQQVFVSDERDTLDDSSFVSMRQAQ